MPDFGTDQYSIEIKSLRTGETVILASVEMTEQEKSVVVRQLLFGYWAHRQRHGLKRREPKKSRSEVGAGVHARKGCSDRQNRQLQS